MRNGLINIYVGIIIHVSTKLSLDETVEKYISIIRTKWF